MEFLWQRLCTILVNASAEGFQLNTVEPLFCAAFRSTHRDIVSFAAETWNRIYEHADHIEYPETLKNVLASLGSSVDVFRPGLEIVDDFSNARPSFTESQDDGNHFPSISPARFQPTPLSRPSASSRSATPISARVIENCSEGSTPLARRKSKGRTSKAKLRHEDSQMQFAAIESSPAPVVQESQLLTDRQKEIRERQRETAAMFPAVRSSPTEKTQKARLTNSQQPNAPIDPHRASTPEHGDDFDDCLTSTPTPRRGQPVSLPEQDQEMTDPPSSPPEPRSFRLLAELKCQASQANSMDDWHFSSSPIFGSPNQTNQTNSVSQSMELDDVDEELRLDHENEVAHIVGIPKAAQQDASPSQLVIDDTIMYDQSTETDLPATVDHNASQYLHTTPSGRTLLASAAQVTPRSDNDEFVDARASPMPPTPSQTVRMGDPLFTGRRESPRQTTNSQSFDVSISFENGLRNVGTGKIEIPLRSSQSSSPRKREYASYEDILPESPEQQESQVLQSASQPEEATEALDVIEVAGEEIKKSRRSRSRKFRRGSASELILNVQQSQGSQAPVPSTPVEELAATESQGSFDNVSPGSGRWWRKRKRSVSSSVISSGGSKKLRHEDFLAVDSIQEELPDSQAAADLVQDQPVELQTTEELDGNLKFFTSNENISLVEHTTASQELPSAADEDPLGDLQPEPEVEPASEVDISETRAKYMEDIDNYTDDEEAVHSQLAREEEESASRAASPARHVTEPAATMKAIAQDDEDGEAAAPVPEQIVAEDVQQLAHEPRPANTFDGLMDMFRNGLYKLRTTNLSREQVYEVEDLMFDMRRELLQAERRGRD